MNRQYFIKVFRYVVTYRGEFGKHLAYYDASNAEELAEKFFADHKHVDYDIIYKEELTA